MNNTKGRPQSQRPEVKQPPKRPLTAARGPGWEPDAPVRITAETKITIAPPLPEPRRTQTFSIL